MSPTESEKLSLKVETKGRKNTTHITMHNIQEFLNRIICGDCVEVLKQMPSESVDLVVADPPDLVNYRSSDGRGYANDNPQDTSWLLPAMQAIYRVLKQDTFCVCFFGWHQTDKFLRAWRRAGFRTMEHLVWVKDYPSSVGMVQRFHEAAYLLAKGRPPRPQILLRSVFEWRYTGAELHPTQKPVLAILPLILAYSRKGEIVLDPFSGSGTTAVAAKQAARQYIGIEISEEYSRISQGRLSKTREE